MNQLQRNDANTLPATTSAQEATNLANPMVSAALSMMTLEDPAKAWGREDVLMAIRDRIERVNMNDFNGIESMLAAQTQVLHLLFTRSVEKYATCEAPEKSFGYSDLALKSQNFCRRTAATITYMKQVKETKLTGKSFERDKKALSGLRKAYAATLGGGMAEPGSFEKWLIGMRLIEDTAGEV